MDCTCPLRDVMCTCQLSLLILRSEVLNRTLCHISWRLYLPTFLLSVGLLTLMYIDSLIVLAMPWYSLPMMLSCLGLCCALSGCCVHGWVRVPSGAPWTFLQRSWRSPLFIPCCISGPPAPLEKDSRNTWKNPYLSMYTAPIQGTAQPQATSTS